MSKSGKNNLLFYLLKNLLMIIFCQLKLILANTNILPSRIA